MRTVLIVKKNGPKGKSILPKVLNFLLVDLVPIILLLVMMACGMVWVAERLQEPRGVEITTYAAEPS